MRLAMVGPYNNHHLFYLFSKTRKIAIVSQIGCATRLTDKLIEIAGNCDLVVWHFQSFPSPWAR